MYKLLITTSGTGSRLGELTKKTNKALVPINGRPTIEYILEKYSVEVPVVVTIGYLADQVKEYLEKHHPERKIEFAMVDKYEGPGSSLGYSLLCAKEYLQCPFIFHACDTIMLEELPEPTRNWAIGYVPSDPSFDADPYRTHKVADGKLVTLQDKGAKEYDAIHIGLTGVHDYAAFWDTLRGIYDSNLGDTGLSDVHVLIKMLEQGISFDFIPCSTWLDTGSPTSLQITEQYLHSYPIAD